MKAVRRIMLVIDDFNELVGLETLFRRLGFDVLSLSRESSVAEAVLGFTPDLTIATGRGRHVDGLRMAPKLRYGTSSQSKLVVLLPADEPSTEPDLAYAEVDAVIETPFEPTAALRLVAIMLGIEVDVMLEKYAKIVNAKLFEPTLLKIVKHPPKSQPLLHITATEPAARPIVPTAPGAVAASESRVVDSAVAPVREPTARETRYAKFLDDKAEEVLPPVASIEARRQAMKKLDEAEAKASIEEVQKAARLAREKREFVRAMIEAGNEDLPERDQASGKKTKS